jgi:hypothetical protein
MEPEDKRPEDEPPIQLQVRFVSDPGVRTTYATNMMVQATDHEFILTFFEARPPFISGNTPDERRSAAAKLEAVEAVEVARVIIAPNRMQMFIDLLTNQIERRSATSFDPAQPRERTTR